MHTYLVSLFGGVLIGLSASGLLLINGKIAGISGILSGAVSLRPEPWRLAFLAGLLSAGLASHWLGLAAPTALHDETPWLLASAGLLVGLGTRLSGGCTSGHGVCGLANLSLRSLIATVTFMVVATGVVFVTRHVDPIHQLLWGAPS